VRERVFIAASNRPDLYRYALEEFAGEPAIRVVLDRRTGERRCHRVPVSVDQRTGERRHHADLDARLVEMGFAIAFV
jgi:hypothetical protein